MADLRAEQILAAIKTLLIGLATTGSNVQRGQVHGHEADKLPALALTMGQDIPAAEYQTGIIDWELTIVIEATASVAAAYTATESGLDGDLNQIRKEVYLAVMVDHTLGLDFVIDIAPGPAAEPVLSAEGNLPVGSQAIEFVITYRASRTDISEG